VEATHDNGDRGIGAEWEVLNGGRRAGRDTSGSNQWNENDVAGNFHPIDRRGHFHDQGRSRDSSAGSGADRTNVGIKRTRIQVNEAVQLPRKEDASEDEPHEEKPL
jgi:hypothetical protein